MGFRPNVAIGILVRFCMKVLWGDWKHVASHSEKDLHLALCTPPGTDFTQVWATYSIPSHTLFIQADFILAHSAFQSLRQAICIKIYPYS